MTIAPDLVAQILRLHTVEKWRVGTIARQLHVHNVAQLFLREMRNADRAGIALNANPFMIFGVVQIVGIDRHRFLSDVNDGC